MIDNQTDHMTSILSLPNKENVLTLEFKTQGKFNQVKFNLSMTIL